jgi:hypothetical protein
MTLRQSLISALIWCVTVCVAAAQPKSSVPISGTGDASAAPAVISAPPVLAEVESVHNSVTRVRERLIDLLNDESARRIDRQQAINGLGRFPSLLNISPLLKHLLFRADIITEAGPLASFPAAVKLAAYGNNIYPTAWGAALREWSEDFAYVLAFTLYTADGKEVAIVRAKQRLADPGATFEQKKNFAKLLEFLTNTDFHDYRNWPNATHPKPK